MTLAKRLEMERRKRALIDNNVRRVLPPGRIYPVTGSIRCPQCFKCAEIVYQDDPLAKMGKGNFIICAHCGYRALHGLHQFGNQAAQQKAMRRMTESREYRILKRR